MKKIFSFFVASMMALTSFATTHHIYIDNQTGWETVTLYGWYEGKEDVNILGGWPGADPAAETVVKDDVTYLDFAVEDTAFPFNAIFNDKNSDAQLADYLLETAGDYYLVATTGGMAEAGATFVTYHVYVNNQTGWDNFYLYSWADPKFDAFGSWPGTKSDDVPTVTVNEVDYLDFAFEIAEGAEFSYNLIFHNNVGEGQEGDHRQLITISEARDYYLNVPSEGDITEAGQTLATYHLYVKNNTDWEDFYLYAWGDKEFFGNWPGKKSTDVATVTIEEVEYLDFEYTLVSTATEMSMNLIFHNNVGEGQPGDKRVLVTLTEPKDDFVTVEYEEEGQGVANTAVKVRAMKTIKNGQLIIVRDGVEFNALGTKL